MTLSHYFIWVRVEKAESCIYHANSIFYAGAFHEEMGNNKGRLIYQSIKKQ
jgi:hypothetical protein